MIDLLFTKVVNPELLHNEITAVLGSNLIGVSTGPEKQLRVHLHDDTPAADQALVAGIVAAHDSAQLTDRQKRLNSHAAFIATLHKPWNHWNANEKDDFLRLLADQLLDDGSVEQSSTVVKTL
jgi:hypothetical protein